MPRPHPTPPDPDHCWPSCDQAEPGVSIRPLRRSDLPALLAHLTHGHDQDEQPGQRQGEGLRVGPAGRPPAAGGPVVAVRVRASVGRPGASAQGEYRRRRATELAAWRRSLPWRAAAVLLACVAGQLLSVQLAPDLGGLFAVVAATAVGWRLRFRPSADTRAWRRGAAGERRTARLLAPWSATAGRSCTTWPSPAPRRTSTTWSSAPGGVAVLDSKRYRGRLRLDSDGMLWHGRHLLVSALRKTRWEADQADEILGIADLQVPAIVAVHGASVPWGRVQADGVTVIPARRLPDLLRTLPPILVPERVAWLADRARLRFHAAA